MRTLLIFLSIGLFCTLIQYSYGAPAEPILSESEEDNSVETKVMTDLKPISNFNDENDESDESDENDETTTQSNSIVIQVNENDQSSEEAQKTDGALELTQKLGEPFSIIDQDESDDQSNVASFVNDDHRRILEDDDED